MATRQTTTVTSNTLSNEQGGTSPVINGRMAAIIGIVVLVVVAGVWYFVSAGEQGNTEAAIALGRIRPYYEKGEYAAAINGDPSKTINGEKVRGLVSIVEEWSSTKAGKAAALLLGNCYQITGQNQKAAEAFEIAAGAKDELVTAPANAGLAAVAEANGKHEDAAKAYEKAASEDHLELNTPQYLLGAARNYERAGNNDAAKELYRKVATQFPQSPANAQARLALARFNVEL